MIDLKCIKCNSDMQLLDYGEDFKYFACSSKECFMTLTKQKDYGDVWEDKKKQ